ncbi:hypothetical protein D3C73_1014500 [compost metagenome]
MRNSPLSLHVSPPALPFLAAPLPLDNPVCNAPHSEHLSPPVAPPGAPLPNPLRHLPIYALSDFFRPAVPVPAAPLLSSSAPFCRQGLCPFHLACSGKQPLQQEHSHDRPEGIGILQQASQPGTGGADFRCCGVCYRIGELQLCAYCKQSAQADGHSRHMPNCRKKPRAVPVSRTEMGQYGKSGIECPAQQFIRCLLSRHRTPQTRPCV